MARPPIIARRGQLFAAQLNDALDWLEDNAGSAQRYGNYIGVLIVGSDPGSIRVEWGQAVSGAPAEATTLKAESMMMLRRVA